MKTPWKIAVLLPLAALCLKGCIKPDKEYLAVSVSRIEIPALQINEIAFDITANCMWTIESTDNSWFSVDPSRGYLEKRVTITASQNTSLSSRRAKLLVKSEAASQEVEIVQLGEEPTITFALGTVSIAASKEEVEIEISTNIELVVSTNVPWVSYVATKLMSSSTYCFKVEKNTGLEARTAKITFSQRGGSFSKELTLTQMGEAPSIVLAETGIKVGAEGDDDLKIALVANIPWTATPLKDWIHVLDLPTTKLMESDFCYFTVDSNPRVEARDAILRFTGEKAETKDLVISQEGAVAVATFTPAQYLTTAAAAKYKIEVSANFNWTVDESKTETWVKNIDWDLAVGSCNFEVEANPDVATRTTKIIFKQTEVPDSKAKSYEYLITQAPAAAQLFFATEPYPFPAELNGTESTRFFLVVKANVPWELKMNQLWLSVQEVFPTDFGSHDKAFWVTVAENTSTDKRTGEISFVSETIVQKLTIIQTEGRPRLSVTPRRIEAPAQGITQAITISSNVGWSCSYRPSWVSLEAVPATKATLKDTTVLAVVEKNTSLNPRNDIIVFRQNNANLRDTVFVTQDGIIPSFSASFPGSASGAGEARFVLTIDPLKTNYPVDFEQIVYDPPVKDGWVHLIENVQGKTYTFKVDSTNSGFERRARIWFKNATGSDELRNSVELVQRGAAVSVADSTVLVRLYRAASGVMWTHKWDLNQPVDKWFGITLSGTIIKGELRVIELSLPGESLVGSLVGGVLTAPVAFDEMEYLTKLNLSGNLLLSGELPENLYRLTFLQELDLSNCSFSNAGSRNIPEEWGGKDSKGVPYFALLKKLKVSGNLLNGTVPQSIKDRLAQPDLWPWDWERDIEPQRSGNKLLLP